MAKAAERYYKLGDDTIEKINSFISKFVHSPVRLDYDFIGDNKLKKLVKITKFKDDVTFLYKTQVLITVNESLLDLLQDDETIELLFREEFNTLAINTESGKVKIEKLTFNTSPSIIDKYSYDAVKRAKDLEKLTLQQTEDKDSDVVDISA